jgi:hypothetical protein
MATIVKILTETGATRFINLDNVQDVVVSGDQVAVYFSQDDETADVLTLGEAAPLLDALEMLAAETDRKIWFEKETTRAQIDHCGAAQ